MSKKDKQEKNITFEKKPQEMGLYVSKGHSIVCEVGLLKEGDLVKEKYLANTPSDYLKTLIERKILVEKPVK